MKKLFLDFETRAIVDIKPSGARLAVENCLDVATFGDVVIFTDNMPAFGALNRKLIDQLPLIQQGKSDFDKWGVAVRDAHRGGAVGE